MAGEPKNQIIGRGGGDKSNLKWLKWGVIVPEGANGQELFEKIKPLVKLRADQSGSPVKPYELPKGLEAQGITRWVTDTLPDKEGTPRFLLLLGGEDDIPWEVQRALSIQFLFPGRLVLPNVQDYEAYATRVCEWEADAAARGSVVVTRFLEDEDEIVGAILSCFGMHAPKPQESGLLSRPEIHLPGRPFAIMGTVPLAWLSPSPSPTGESPSCESWLSADERSSDLNNLFLNALPLIESERVGLTVSANSETVAMALTKDLTMPGGGKAGCMLLGDPALYFGRPPEVKTDA